MKHYIIDTFNVINKSNFIKSRAKKDKTTAVACLVELIKAYQEKYRSSKFTLVCDGLVDEPLNLNHSINLICTKDSTADDYIKQIIEKTRSKSNLIVISSDLEVYSFAKANLCEVLQSDKFLQLIQIGDNPKIRKTKTTISEKPFSPSKKEIKEFKKMFGVDDYE